MKRTLSKLKYVALVTVAVNGIAVWASPAEVLEKAIYAEETKGELAAAAELYRQVVNDAGADRALAAQAQVRLGLCELKLGNKREAISELEQLRTEFPDKTKLLAILEQHMPSLLDEILNQIQNSYIQTVDRGELMETALRAIIGKLDANSGILRPEDMAFLSARELAEVNQGMQQKFAGVGLALKADEVTGDISVTSVLPGSAALKGGVRAGDRILEVDDMALPGGKELETAVKLLRGQIGTPVNVTIRRGGSGNVEKLRLVRDNVRLPSVKGDRYRADGSPEFVLDAERKIGYVRLTQVGQETPSEMEGALKELRAQGMRGLILDLRNNPGGLLSEAVSVSDLFLDQGRILSVKGRTNEEVFEAKKQEDFVGFPIAVIVNRQTASAAEIIAAALQDNGRAAVIGERTFGQGVVKSIVPLKDGIGALKLPVAAYFRPSGANMNRYPALKESDDWGVKPDSGYEVVFSDAEKKAYEKYRNDRDVIDAAGATEGAFDDRQLQKALEYLSRELAARRG
jgi:carboxyl-terminal processing protease